MLICYDLKTPLVSVTIITSYYGATKKKIKVFNHSISLTIGWEKTYL
jgi:hypothetical protein